MKIFFFDTHAFEKDFFCQSPLAPNHEITFFEGRLTEKSAPLAKGFPCVCPFVNDDLSAPVLKELHQNGTRLIALRSAGFNHVDLHCANELGLRVVRVPEYSPYSVAEHALGLLQCLNRKLHRAYNRVREGNFSLDGLMGFDLHGKTVGVIGTGRIGSAFIKICKGFGCEVIAYDKYPDENLSQELGFPYVSLEELYKKSKIISLHIPLCEDTHHLIEEKAIALMQEGVFLINTSRGGLVETKALIQGLKSGKIGAAGLDVYEAESDYFFRDHSSETLRDDTLARLMTFPNVILTSHQGFLTEEALRRIAETTFSNVSAYERGEILSNEVL